jgi:hypothetical protein
VTENALGLCGSVFVTGKIGFSVTGSALAVTGFYFCWPLVSGVSRNALGLVDRGDAAPLMGRFLVVGVVEREPEPVRRSDCHIGPENGADIGRAMQTFARKPNGGLVVAFDAFNAVHAAQIVDLAARYRLPAIYPLRLFTQSGGLFSCGFDQTEQFRQAAS